VPPLPPPGNVVYLAPPQGNSEVEVVGRMPGARLAEVREHAVVAGVENPGTLLHGVPVGLAATPLLRPVVLARAEGREAALVVAGEAGGRRVVATGFTLRPAALHSADQLPSLLFVLDVLRWLAPGAEDAPLEHVAGERFAARLPDASPITRVEGPGGARDLGPGAEIVLERAGAYRVSGGGRVLPLVISFDDPEESAIGRAPFAAGEDAIAPVVADGVSVEAPHEHRALTDDALLVVLVLMVLEWLVLASGRGAGEDPEPTHA
jgi:hypothetical protein